MEIHLPIRNQGPHEGGFLWQEELLFGHCDAQLNLRISSLLEHLVTASSQHIRTFGMTYDSFLESDSAFVLIRTTLNLHKLPKCFQVLTLKTWIDGIKGPYYQRVTQWFNENNEVVISGRSEWVVIKPSTRALCKPDKTDLRFTTTSPVSLPPCEKVKYGDLPLEFLGQHTVAWSEIDGNGHLHSANFGDIIWDHLPEKYRTLPPKSFSMEYQKEGYLGDKILILGGELEETHYIIQGITNDQPAFKASIRF